MYVCKGRREGEGVKGRRGKGERGKGRKGKKVGTPTF